MVKRLKLRLSRVISSLHSTCKSKDPSDLPEVPLPPEPTPPLFMLSPVNPKARDIDFPVPPRPHKLQAQSQSHHKRHLSSILCGCRPKPGSSYSPSPDTTGSSPRDAFGWKQEAKWHVVARVQQLEEEEEPPRRKLYNSSVTDESEGGISPCPLPEKMKKKKKKLRAKKKTKKRNLKCSRGRFSTSSADSGWFSSDGEEEEEEEEEEEKENETETLVSSSRTFSSSSRTLSTDSSTDFGTHHLETIRENPTDTNLQRKKKKKKKKKNVKMVKKVNQRCPLKHSSPSRTGKISACGSSESESPARFSTVFKQLMPCKIEGKVRESFAVVKKSEDPYEDFKRSMLEMIVANQMFDIRDLEQLLHCFLTLNSKHHHAVIVEAFSDIWEILFCK